MSNHLVFILKVKPLNVVVKPFSVVVSLKPLNVVDVKPFSVVVS